MAAHQRLQTERTFSFEGGYQFGENGSQALAAQPAAGFGPQAQSANYYC